MKTIQFCTVGDHGDPSVGINPNCWEINMHGLEVEEENLELLRKEIMDLYSTWSEMGCDYCEFDFELEHENS